MSADNGIYILVTKRRMLKNGNCYTNQEGFEYRVAHCQAIENIDYSDLYIPLLFGDSEVFYDAVSAYQKAEQVHDEMLKNDWSYIEYGICEIQMNNEYFPNMTSRAAAKALENYEGCVPLDYNP